MATSSPWTFERYGRSCHFQIRSADDLARAAELDEAHWVATNAPIATINADATFLQLLDTDHNGRIMCHEVRGAIRWLGRVLEKIDDLQLWDDTIVAVTSDHGTSLGEHDRTGKSNIHDEDPRYWPIYPEIGHVPFLVAGGGVPRGRRLDLIAQPIDILPTLCELADVRVNPPEKFQGRSFADAILKGQAFHREYAVSGSYIRSSDATIPARAVTPFLVTERWGYAPVGAHGEPELYDLTVDEIEIVEGS